MRLVFNIETDRRYSVRKLDQMHRAINAYFVHMDNKKILTYIKMYKNLYALSIQRTIIVSKVGQEIKMRIYLKRNYQHFFLLYLTKRKILNSVVSEETDILRIRVTNIMTSQ